MKKALFFLSLMIFALIIVGCSSTGEESNGNGGTDEGGSSDESVEVSIWATNINVPVLEEAAAAYKEQNPNLTVNVEEMNNNDIRSKVTTGLQARGQGLPDAALLVDDGVTGYVTNFPDQFVNVGEMGFSEFTSDFPEYKVNSVSYDGSVYAIPFDAGPVGVFYRTDLFEEAGVNAEDINTWDDYIEAGIKIKEATGANMLSYDSNDSTVYTIFLSQQGLGYFSAEGESNMDTEASVNTANAFKQMADAEILLGTPGWDAWVTSLSESQTATAIAGGWLVGTLQQSVPDQAGNWGVMPLPQFEGNDSRSANQGGSSFTIFESSENKQAIYDFLEFFATDFETQELAMDGGLFPSYLPVYDSELFSEELEYFGNEPVWEFFADQMTQIPSVLYTENDQIARDEAIKVQAEVVQGADPQEAVEGAQGRIENRLQ